MSAWSKKSPVQIGPADLLHLFPLQARSLAEGHDARRILLKVVDYKLKNPKVRWGRREGDPSVLAPLRSTLRSHRLETLRRVGPE